MSQEDGPSFTIQGMIGREVEEDDHHVSGKGCEVGRMER